MTGTSKSPDKKVHFPCLYFVVIVSGIIIKTKEGYVFTNDKIAKLYNNPAVLKIKQEHNNFDDIPLLYSTRLNHECIKKFKGKKGIFVSSKCDIENLFDDFISLKSLGEILSV